MSGIKKMNAMKLKIFYFSLLFASVLLSCKKEEQTIVENPGLSLLSKVNIDNQPFYEYSYTGTNLVSEEKSKYGYTKHIYNDKNLVVSTDFYGNLDILSSDPVVSETAINRKDWVTPANGSKSGSIKYEYNSNNQLIKTIYTRPQSACSEYSEFSYDASNRITRQIVYWENVETGYTDYLYDTKGNLVKESLYSLPATGAAELSTTTEYVFDNQLNPFKSFSRLVTPGINTNINNITKETYTIHPNGTTGTAKMQVAATTYTYNVKGYPVSKNNNIAFVYI
jgi:hypothetical protein